MRTKFERHMAKKSPQTLQYISSKFLSEEYKKYLYRLSNLKQSTGRVYFPDQWNQVHFSYKIACNFTLLSFVLIPGTVFFLSQKQNIVTEKPLVVCTPDQH